jgi:hypothetical protein
LLRVEMFAFVKLPWDGFFGDATVSREGFRSYIELI